MLTIRLYVCAHAWMHLQVQRFGPKRILHESPEFDALATRAAER